MAKILFRLRMVPEDEAQEVRELLDRNRISWFETSAGRFGVSFPAIWLSEDDDWTRAKKVLDDYQSERAGRLRADHEDEIERGTAETFWSRLVSHPLQILAVLCAVAVIAYFSVIPFFSLLES